MSDPQAAPSGRLVLDLVNGDRLFSVDDADPFEEGYDCVSGMRRLVEAVGERPARSWGHGRIVLRLPDVGDGKETPERFKAAIARHSEAHAADRDREAAVKRREGVQTAMLAGIFVLVTVALSLVVEGSGFLPPLLLTLLVDGLVIAGWVAIWRPLDLLLYEPWLLRRQARILRAIGAMPVSVEYAERRRGDRA